MSLLHPINPISTSYMNKDLENAKKGLLGLEIFLTLRDSDPRHTNELLSLFTKE